MKLPQVPNMDHDYEKAIRSLYDYVAQLRKALETDTSVAATKIGLVGAGATRDALDEMLKLL